MNNRGGRVLSGWAARSDNRALRRGIVVRRREPTQPEVDGQPIERPLVMPSVQQLIQTRVIHHGYAKRSRKLRNLIEAVALADERFVLDLMLMEGDEGYVDELREEAALISPRRVHFRDPVAPGHIVSYLSQYDAGLCVAASSPSLRSMKLPSRLFECIQAGLALVVSPCPAMVALVEQYGVGVVAASSEPEALASALNQLTDDRLLDLRQAARRAAAVLATGVAAEAMDQPPRLSLDGQGGILGE